ncbi:MAG: TetR/AcrR family transcriptional regulator [Rhizobiaceae bacterium]
MSKIRPDTREAIIEAAFQVFNETPGAKLEDVAARAGVGRATLHRHFSSRETLMIELGRQAVRELDVAIEEATKPAQTYSEGLRLALAAMVPLAQRQWFLSHEPVDRDPEIAGANEKGSEELKAAIEAAKSEGAFGADVPTGWIASAYENLTYAAWTMVRDGEATLSQAADLAWRTLTKGTGGDRK